MSRLVTTKSDIPDAPWYVLSNDTFMSGWGHSEGRTNTIILPCESYDEALVVEANAMGRTDQQRVRIVANKPRLRDHITYSLMDRNDAAPWYTPGRWR